MIGLIAGQLACLLAGLLALQGAGGAVDDPDVPEASSRPIYVILEPPADLQALLGRLGSPDLVVQPWSRKQEAAELPGAGVRPLVASVTVRGEIGTESAAIEVEVEATVTGPGPTRLALGLGGLPLTSVTERGEPIAAEVVEGSWTVPLSGEGVHPIEVRLLVPLQSDGTGRRLALAIPEAPVTRLALRGPAGLTDPRLGNGTPLATVIGPDGAGVEILASLPPRPLVELRWRTLPATDVGEPLLTCQGDVALAVRDDGIALTATYELRALRGEKDALKVRLDPADRLLAIDLDGNAAEYDRAGETVTIPLATPLRPGPARKLTISARRPVAGPGGSTSEFRGFPLEGFAVQTGLIAVSRQGPAWVGGTAGSGLRQVEPRSDLSAALRLLPSVVLGYQYHEQPFMLSLRVDSTPPWLAVTSETWVRVGSESSEVAARLEYRTARGRLFEVRFAVPAGLMLESVGPPESVQSSAIVPTDPGVGPGADPEPARELIVRLKPEATAAGQFAIWLEGRQAGRAEGPIRLGLFRPWGQRPIGGRVSVLTARDVTVEAVPGPDFRPAEGDRSVGLPAFEDLESATGPPLRFEDSGVSATLPIRATVHAPELIHRSTIEAKVGPDGVEVGQSVGFQARYGVVSRVEIAVPASLAGRWEVEGFEVARREPLGRLPDGGLRFRLILAREIVEDFALRFRLRGAPLDRLPTGRATEVAIPRVRVLTGTAGPSTVEVAADPALRLTPVGSGWVEGPSAVEGETSGTGGLSKPFPAELPDSLAVNVEPLVPADLPPITVRRLWVSSRPTDLGAFRVTARYRIEPGVSEVVFELPAASRLESVRVDEKAVDPLQMPAAKGRFRALIAASEGPVVLTIETRSAASTGSLEAPRLLDSVVQEVCWDVWLGWDRTVLGIPEGWDDANLWRFEGLSWRRMPDLGEVGLRAWLTGRPGSFPATEAGPVGDFQRFLFARTGGLAAIRPTIAQRAALVAGCSGAVVGLGLLVLLRKVSWRLLWAWSAVVGVVAAAWVHPSLWPAVAQASAAGVLLVVLAGFTQVLVESRSRIVSRPRGSGRFGTASEARVPPSASTTRTVPTSDELEGSTVIRKPAASTVDHGRPVAAPSGRADRSDDSEGLP